MQTCPFCNSTQITLSKEFSTKIIADLYQKQLGISVEHFFKLTSKISLFKCDKCYYEFYYPFDIEGDGEFYHQLGKLSWYYMNDKWEHQASLKFITQNSKVLEIGCGNGAFLRKLKDRGIEAEGLELNTDAVKKCQKNSLRVYEKTIEDFSQDKKNELYDIVCSYQVLEHIVKPKQFLESAISVLKPGGLLIIAVPNNDSFIKEDIFPILNMPPHHFGLYGKNHLSFWPKMLPIKIISILLEPLQKYHFRYYYQIKIGQYLGDNSNLISKIINKLLFCLSYPLIAVKSPKITSHTILAIYSKN